jgi:hypothetical protein
MKRIALLSALTLTVLVIVKARYEVWRADHGGPNDPW